MVRTTLLLLLSFPLFGSWNFSLFKDWVEKTQPQSMDELVNQLPESFSKNYVLLHHSLSLDAHATSPRYPRVLFYSGNLIMSITGDPEFEHYNGAEFIEWVPKQRNFQFHRLHFQKAKPVSIESNPQICNTCHDYRAPRPLWATSPFFPEAYGSFGDRFLTIEEQKEYSAYERETLKKGRYAGLTLTPNANHNFLHHLNSLNDQKITEDLKEWKSWPKYRWAVQAALRDCGQIESFLPLQTLKAHQNRLEGELGKLPMEVSPSQWLAKNSEENSKTDWLRKTNVYQLSFELKSPPLPLEVPQEWARVGALRLILEGAGYSMKSWSLSHPLGGMKHTYDFQDGKNGIARLLPQLVSDISLPCTKLREQSLLQLSNGLNY